MPKPISIAAKIQGLNRFDEFVHDATQKFDAAALLSLQQLAEDIKRDAIANIQLGSAGSRYPSSGRLASSINWITTKYGIEISVGDGSTPYAYLQNDPNPVILHPTTSTKLRFFWYRFGKPSAFRQVTRIGNEFFTKAWVANVDRLQQIFDQKLAQQGTTLSEIRGRSYYNVRDSRGRFTR